MPDTAALDLDAPVHTYASSDFELDSQQCCDLILKGGITSGVVYPHAICELATRYRLLEIGGTSAGAMGAAFAAAAEYQRQRASSLDASGSRPGHASPEAAGYLRISRLYDVFGEPDGVFNLFQPHASLRPHFMAAVGALRALRTAGASRVTRIALALAQLVAQFPGAALCGLLLAVGPLVLALSSGSVERLWPALLASALAIVGGLVLALVGSAGWAVGTAAARLGKANFGLCSGMRSGARPGRQGRPGLTEWLHAELQATAGLAPDAPPLTFRDLHAHRIRLRVITTDLAMGRPFELGLEHAEDWQGEEHFGAYHYLRHEFEALFPPVVVEAMIAASGGVPVDSYDGQPLYRWPSTDRLPVVVATRLSFGLPLLLQAIPLYRRDTTLPAGAARQAFQRCLLTDGGISSNLPIHFFDRAFPDRPTFAVSMERHSERRHGTDPAARVAMFTGGQHDVADPLHARDGGWLTARRRGISITAITSLFDFAHSILHSASNWQDTLQSAQAGYRDRIVHVALKEEEGGLNLDIGPEVVRRMVNVGRLAGQRLLAFELGAHRWRRFLSLTDMVERDFADIAERWHDVAPSGANAFRDFVCEHGPNERHFPLPGQGAEWVKDVQAFYDRVTALAQADPDKRLSNRIVTPRPRTDLKSRPRL